MRNLILLALLAICFLYGCNTTPERGASSDANVITPQGANNSPIGGDQRTATGTEQGTVSLNDEKVVNNFIGFKRAKMNHTSADGATTELEVEGVDGEALNLTLGAGASIGTITEGSENTKTASTASGSTTGNN